MGNVHFFICFPRKIKTQKNMKKRSKMYDIYIVILFFHIFLPLPKSKMVRIFTVYILSFCFTVQILFHLIESFIFHNPPHTPPPPPSTIWEHKKTMKYLYCERINNNKIKYNNTTKKSTVKILW